MTNKRDELRKFGETLFGDRWQTPLARTLGMDASMIRKMLSGARDIRDETIERVEMLTKRARWNLGYGEDGCEYLTHMIYPQFSARVFQDGRDPAPSVSGVTMEIQPGIELADFIWSDKVPEKETLVALRHEAAAAMEIITADDHEAMST